jgi:hypothetical protein
LAAVAVVVLMQQEQPLTLIIRATADQDCPIQLQVPQYHAAAVVAVRLLVKVQSQELLQMVVERVALLAAQAMELLEQ